MDDYKKYLKNTIEICNITIDNMGREEITPDLLEEARKIKARTILEIKKAHKGAQDKITTQGEKATREDLQNLREWQEILVYVT